MIETVGRMQDLDKQAWQNGRDMEEDYNNPECLAFWEELQEKVALDVSCSSWDINYAIKCFGEDYQNKTITGHITKVRISRGAKKKVTFDVTFPEKKYEKKYGGFDVDYIWKYARDVPDKYHRMRAAYLVELARTAGMLAAADEPSSSNDRDNLKAGNDDENAESSDEEENSEEEPQDSEGQDKLKRKGKGKSSITPARKARHCKGDHDQVLESDMESEREIDSDGEDDNDDDDEEEHDNYEGTEEEKIDAQGTENLTSERFVMNREPFIEDLPFTGSPGPKHTLSPENAVPFDYFCLYIPIYFWSLWEYTNKKSCMLNRIN